VLGIDGGGFGRAVRLVDRSGLAAWPTFFGYQFILEADPRPEQLRSPSGDQDGERRDERDGAEEPDDLHRPPLVE
jgi:hypothetical protein